MRRKLHNLLSIIVIISILSSFAISSNASIDSNVISIDNYSMATSTGVEGFVVRLYSLVLGRTPDQGGFDDWCSKLYSFEMDGGNVARSFFYSQEYLNKNVPFEEYLTTLYAVFFNRAPDQGGFDNWCNFVYNGGHSRHEVLDGFINSAEWSNVCASFGIVSGSSTAPTITVNANQRICAFVTALYSEVLGRSPDAAGFNDWTNRIATCQITGKEAAYGFFYSPEFMNKCANLTNEQIVNIFYSVFLGRGADPAGMSNWINQINQAGGFNSTSLTSLFNGFADSTEFKNICAEYGIAHSIPSSNPIPAPNVQTSEPGSVTPTPTQAPTRSEVMTVTISLTNGQTTTVTGYYDYGMAEELFNLVNDYRSSNGVTTLTWNDTIAEYARLRAAEINYSFSHDRPNGNDCFSGCSLVYGENICAGYRSAQAAFDTFRNSPGHNANMIRSGFRIAGFGVFVVENDSNRYNYYVVQNFGY